MPRMLLQKGVALFWDCPFFRRSSGGKWDCPLVGGGLLQQHHPVRGWRHLHRFRVSLRSCPTAPKIWVMPRMLLQKGVALFWDCPFFRRSSGGKRDCPPVGGGFLQ
jgi:hypothetical protein